MENCKYTINKNAKNAKKISACFETALRSLRGDIIKIIFNPHPGLTATPLLLKERGRDRGSHPIATIRATPTGLEEVKFLGVVPDKC